ncbi:uncharacterized protein [Venturia canescens]|uniref:uncharacterized protein n=1 Tax=Venturia canescens TaxID=32260 RepID=UPI001C9D20E7|nr:uncharacterized protein LOC122418356 [Venturia canescens]
MLTNLTLSYIHINLEKHADSAIDKRNLQNTLSSKNKTTENEEQSAINDDESPSVFAGNSANEERRTNHEDKSSDVEPDINVIELFDAESTLVEGSPKIPEDDITTYENETDMPDTDDENVSNKVNPASINNTLENSHLKIHGDDEMITSRNKPTIVETKILPKGSYVLVKEEKEQIKYKREASNRKVEDNHTPVKKSDRRRMKLEFKYDSSSPSPVTNQNLSPVTPTANNNEQNPTMYCEEKTERIAPKKMTADEILKKVDYYVSDLRCLKRPAKTPRNVTEKSVVTSTITKTRSTNDIASKIYDFRNDIDPCEGSSKSLEFDSRCSSKKKRQKTHELIATKNEKAIKNKTGKTGSTRTSFETGEEDDENLSANEDKEKNQEYSADRKREGKMRRTAQKIVETTEKFTRDIARLQKQLEEEQSRGNSLQASMEPSRDGNVELIPGIVIPQLVIIKACGALNMRRRLNILIDGYWSKEEQKNLVLMDNKKNAGTGRKQIPQKTVNGLIDLCFALQKKKRIPTDGFTTHAEGRKIMAVKLKSNRYNSKRILATAEVLRLARERQRTESQDSQSEDDPLHE